MLHCCCTNEAAALTVGFHCILLVQIRHTSDSLQNIPNIFVLCTVFIFVAFLLYVQRLLMNAMRRMQFTRTSRSKPLKERTSSS
jgi:hypothetical protein